MNKIELYKMAFSNLFRRKSRSILAILGVVIGTASIITMVSIGLGITKNFTDMMQKNSNLHVIEIYGVGSGQNSMAGSPLKMDEKAIKKIQTIPGVSYVSPEKNMNLRMVIDRYTGEVNIRAIEPEMMVKMNMEMKKGKLLNKGDKFKFVFGSQVPLNFQNQQDGKNIDYSPTGDYKLNMITPKLEVTSNREFKKVRGNRSPFGGNSEEEKEKVNYEVFKGEGVGILESDMDAYTVYTSLETLDEIEKSDNKARNAAGEGRNQREAEPFSTILVYVENLDHVGDVVNSLREDGFQFYSVMDEIKASQKQYSMIQGALGGIGAISLFVAAIGITNTMIMSIYERTREIGVMKVIGASLKNIKELFLYEAASIGLIGGIIGSVLSIIISFTINFFYAKYVGGMQYMEPGAEEIKQTISYIPFWLIAFGILFSTMIGVVSGYLPAKKAMSLSALESLRN